MSAFALYQLEYLFRNQILEPKYKAARFQILMTAQRLLDKQKIPQMNSHDMARYCETHLKTWWDSSVSEELLKRAAKIIDDAADGDLHRDRIRTQPFTIAIRAGAVKVMEM